MTPGRADELLRDAHSDFARFYGPDEGLDLGVGLILRGVAFPIYLDDEQEYATAVGTVYVVSHECDIDPDNARPFNDRVLICPIIPLEIVLEDYLPGIGEEKLEGFIRHLGRRNIDRIAYIPPIADDLPYGGVLYFSAISHTHIAELTRDPVTRSCAVSAFGLRYIDTAMHQALLKRPKANVLPLTDQLRG